MSTVADTGYPTLDNVLKSLRPDGSVETQVANTLTKKNSLIRDMPFKEGNLPTGHRVTSVLGLPSIAWRKLNQGITPTKAPTVQFDEACGMMEASSEIDVAVAAMFPDQRAYRAGQDAAKSEAFAQEFSRAAFYESASASPEKIHGLAARYGGTSGYTASSYVFKPGSNSGTNCESVWLINWHPERLCGIYPKGSVGGLQIEDKGQQWAIDANNKRFWAWVTNMVWKTGICVEDYRYACRFQWDPDDTSTFPDSGKQFYLTLQDMMAQVYDLMPSARLYMSRTSLRKLNNQLVSNDQRPLEYVTDPATKYGLAAANAGMVPTFEGIPIRIDDSLTGESAIS